MLKIIIFVALGITLTIIFLGMKNIDTKDSYVTISRKKVKVDIARTPVQKAGGLMFRKSLEKDTGMLFIFSNEAKHTFWMVNTLIPLDMIWISSDNKIVHIQKDAKPCTESVKSFCATYKPDEKAKYVLEVNSGWAGKNNIKIGDNVSFDISSDLLK